MSTNCYHTNYSNQKNNKNTGLPRSLRSLVMTGAESFLYSTYFSKAKQQTFAMPGTQATAMLLGVQKRFNWRSLAASIATAPIGMNHTFGASTSFSSIVGDIMISTTQNVLSQAIQGQVDIGNVVLTAFTTAAGAQIPHHFEFPRIEMQNAFIAVTSTAFADMIENHGRINPENIAIAMAGVAAAYGANEINKKLAEYLPKKEMVEKQKPEKPVAKRLNPKAPLSQKELQDVKNAQDKLQRPSAKTPASRSRWQPASGNEMENDVGDIFSAMVDESFKNSDEPRGAEASRRTNEERVEKLSNRRFIVKDGIKEKTGIFFKSAITEIEEGILGLGEMIMHPVKTAEGIGKIITMAKEHPELAKRGFFNGVTEANQAILSGDPEALGQLAGTAVLGAGIGRAARVLGTATRVAGGAAIAGAGRVVGKLGSTWSVADASATLFGRARGSVEVLTSNAAHNAADALRLRTELTLQAAGVLDKAGRLTQKAIENSFPALRKGSVLRNESVVNELTRNGGHITDWEKLSTQSVKMPTGQNIQVHFYRNKLTGEVNYTHPDFKVKGNVEIFPRNPGREPKVPVYKPF